MPTIELPNEVGQLTENGQQKTDLSGHTFLMESRIIGLEKILYIKTAVQTENGEVEYQANLAEKEVAFLLEYAINSLMRQGAIPFAMVKDSSTFIGQGTPEQ